MYNVYNLDYVWNMLTHSYGLLDYEHTVLNHIQAHNRVIDYANSGYRRPLQKSFDGLTYNGENIVTIQMFIGSLSEYVQIITKVGE